MSKKKENDEVITTYKGFDKDLRCRDFRYEVGKNYTHKGPVKACNSGFHACEHPLNVFDYYAPANSRFAVVEQWGDLSRQDGDSKVSSRKIAIKAEIGIAGLVKAAIEYTTGRCKPVDPASPASSTGYRGAASSTGDHGAASSTGASGVAMASGFNGRAMGADGNALFLVFRSDDGSIKHAKSAIVGQDGIKTGVWYLLDDGGEFVEATA